MFVMMPTVWVARSIDWNEENTFYLRIGFGLLHLVAFAVLGLVYQRIQATPNEKKIKVPKKQQPFGANPEGEEPEEMTIQEYDMKEIMEMIKSTAMPVLIIGFIHYKWETAIPLATQFVMLPMKLYQSKLVQIYLLGRDGPEYTRPFKQPENPLAAMMGGAAAGQQTEKKKSTKSEKAKAKKAE